MGDWLEEIGSGKDRGLVPSGGDWLSEIGPEEESPGILGTIGKQALGTADVAASTIHGLTMFPFHLGAEAMGYTAGALLPGVSGKELAERWGGAVESVTLKPGMIEEAILGETGPGAAAGELIGKGFEFIIPREKIQHNLSRMKELGVPEGVADQIAFWWSRGIELTAFSVLHRGGVEGTRKFREKFAEKSERINEAVEKGDVDAAKTNAESLKDLLESEDVKPIRDAIAKTPIEDKITARTEATARRTSAEARESFEQKRNMMKELEDAKRLREDEARVRERGAEREIGEAKGREDLELKTPEEPSVKEEAQVKETPSPDYTRGDARLIAEPIAEGLDIKYDGMQEYPPQLNKPPTYQFTTKDGITFNVEELSKGAVESKLTEMREMRKSKEAVPGIVEKPKKSVVSLDEDIRFSDRKLKREFAELKKEEESIYEKFPDLKIRDSGALIPYEEINISEIPKETLRRIDDIHDRMYQIAQIDYERIDQRTPFLKDGDLIEMLSEEKISEIKKSRIKSVKEPTLHEGPLESTEGLSIIDKHRRFRAIADMTGTSGGSSAIPVLIENKYLFTPEEQVRLRNYLEDINVDKRPTVEQVAEAAKITDLVDYSKKEVGAKKPILREGPPPEKPAPKDYIKIGSKEFPKESVTKTNEIESIIGEDGAIEYDLYGKRKFKTAEDAQKVIDTEKKVQGYREELQASGIDLEVIKVGEKYRIAEPMRATAVEEAAIADFLESRMKDVARELDPKQVETELRTLGEQVKKWHQGDKAIDIYDVENRIASIGNDLLGSKGDPAFGSLLDASDRMLSLIKGERDNLLKPRQVGSDPEMMMAKSPSDPSLDIVLNREGKPFKDMFEALEWNKKKNIGGVVEKHPMEKGWVVEVKEPVPFSEYSKRTWKDIGKDVIEALQLNEERGSISFKEIPPERIEAIRRLIEDARKAGKTVLEFAKQLGYDNKLAEGFQKLADEVAKNIDIDKPDVGTSGFQVGETVNVRPTEKVSKRSGNTISWPKVFEGELKAIKEAQKLEMSKFSEFVPTIHQFNKLDSPYFKSYERAYLAAENIIKAQKKAKDIMVKEMRKEFKSKYGDPKEFGDYLILRQEGGDVRLKDSGIDPAKVKNYEGNPTVKWFDEIFDLAERETNEIRLRTGKDKMPKIPNYYTFMYAEALAGKYGGTPNRFIDPSGVIKERYRQFVDKPFRWTKPRSKLGARMALNRDPFDVLHRYLDQQIEHKNLTPIIAKIAEITKPLKDGKETYTNKAGEVKERNKFYFMSKENPGAHEFLVRWSNWLGGADITNPLYGLEGGKLARALNVMRRNITINRLGANIRTGAIQITALKNTWAMVGLPKTVEGIAGVLSPRLKALAKNNSQVLDLRKSEIAIDELYSGKGKTAAVGKMSTAHIQYMDSITASMSWIAAYKAGKVRGLKSERLFEYADDITTMTQGSSLRGHVAPIQRTAVGKALTLFQTFTISDWNLMYREVFGIGNEGVSKGMVVRRVMDTIIATTLFNMLFEDVLGTNSPLPTPIRAAVDAAEEGANTPEIIGRVLKELIEPIPVIGGAARYGSDPLGPVAEAVYAWSKSLSDPFNTNKMDDAGPFWETTTTMALPTPGTGQFQKSRRAIERGASPTEIILGPRKGKKKSGYGSYGGSRKGYGGYK